jgi:Cys-tRNA(Pro)/Cys-tRNA(Cys) deacylase
MSKTTRATQVLAKAGVNFTLHTYDYDPNAERVGLRKSSRPPLAANRPT